MSSLGYAGSFLLLALLIVLAMLIMMTFKNLIIVNTELEGDTRSLKKLLGNLFLLLLF